MKKIAAAMLAVAITLSFSACGAKESESTSVSGVFVASEKNEKFKKRDYVVFGDYNWQVLDTKGSKALILSERVLEHRSYHNTAEATTWAESDMRSYLNNEFYNSFDENDRKMIVETKLKNPDNPWDFTEQDGNAFTDGGEDTKDYIFLLSLDDIITYFSDNGKDSLLYRSQLGSREISFRDGCEDEIIAYNLNGDASNPRGQGWLLRSPGMYDDTVAYIGGKGSIAVKGTWVEETDFGMRPAMWVKTKALKKSVLKCTKENCLSCQYVYVDNPNLEYSCVICGYADMECPDKERHSRLFHEWQYGNNKVPEERIEEMLELREKKDKLLLEMINMLRDGQSGTNEKTNKIRISRVVSSEMCDRVTGLLSEEMSTMPVYRTLTKEQLDEEYTRTEERIALLSEVKGVIWMALDEVNGSSVTFEENGQRLVQSILHETARELTKEVTDDTNRVLWNSGYYHALFGDMLDGVTYEDVAQIKEDEIDDMFKENKIIEWAFGGEAILDEYLEAVFFSE